MRGKYNLFPISGETLEMQTTREVPDLSNIPLPEEHSVVGYFKNGAGHLLLSSKRGLVGCLIKKDSTLGTPVKVANSREFVNTRKCRVSSFFLCLTSDPDKPQKGLDLVYQTDKEFSRDHFSLVCTGSSKVKVVGA